VQNKDEEIELPAGSSVDAAVDRMIEILQDTARRQASP
jgi:hypothetical protein